MLEQTSHPLNNISYLRQKNNQGTVSHANLILIAFATAFFARVLSGLGAPAVINFVHFLVIPLVCAYILAVARYKDQVQFNIAKAIVIGLGALLAVVAASALLNGAGLINAVLDFMLLSEPFILLLALISTSFSPSTLAVFRKNWLRFSLINLLFALCQIFVLRLGQQNADLVKGIFVGQGSGHVVGASVSMTFAVYYAVTAREQAVWMRIAILLAVLLHVLQSDAKQVLAVFLAALACFLLVKIGNFAKFLQYLLITILSVGVVILLANTVFRALLIWMDLETQQEGLTLKLIGFSIIPTFYQSPLNWLLGLGPGHTISRLGGWMVWEYQDLLGPLGLTTSRASVAVWSAVNDSWLGDRSSWFSPLFGWAGIWGDLGVLGLGVYGSLWWLVWQRLSLNDLARFFVLTVLCFGTILSQIEEPGYMLYMVGIIGLCWHEQRQSQTLSSYESKDLGWS